MSSYNVPTQPCPVSECEESHNEKSIFIKLAQIQSWAVDVTTFVDCWGRDVAAVSPPDHLQPHPGLLLDKPWVPAIVESFIVSLGELGLF